MAILQKIDSNVTGLRYQEETSLGVPNVSNDWVPLEPNSYDAFGGEISTVARNPINETRQRQKGVTTDLDASGGFNSDVTQDNLQDILQGFFFADLRRKGEEIVTSITGGGVTNDYNVALTAGFKVGDLVLASGFTADASNNGVKTVDAITVDTLVSVSETLVNDAAPPADAQLVVVGVEGAAGDIDVSNPGGSYPTLTSTALDWTTLGLIPGEWIFIGGDLAANQFVNAANNGFARIRSITATVLTLDKTQATMVTEASTTELIHVFFGRVLKNESDPTLITRRTYQLERTLGAPEDTQPTQIQAEYLEGSVANEVTFNFNTADKITADLSFVSTQRSTIDGPTTLAAGARPALVSGDAFNTSSDFSRLKMHILSDTDANPTALFGFLTEFTLGINNNASPNKAVSVLGAFEVTAGQFNVEGTATAYFSTVAAVESVAANADVTLDFSIAKGASGAKSGLTVDVPLIALGDGRPTVEQDAPILLPLTTPAGADRVFNHTLLMVFYDFLPDLADI